MTATLTLPLVAWGTAADINAWTDIGTPGITTGVTDPFGGTSAYTVNDNDAGVSEGKLVSTGAITGTLVVLGVCMKAGTATSSSVQFRDTTAGAYTIQGTTAWSGGAPGTPTMGSGSYVGQVALGNSWYLLLFTCAWTTGNVGRIEVYGASNSASTTGTTSYYLRHMVPLSYLDGATTWPEPRTGSAWAEAPSGTEDAWIVGTNWHLAGDLRHIPDTPTDTPEVVGGWYGGGEYAGVNSSVSAMLTAGRDKQSLVWVKDRSTCTTYTSGYLVEPMRGKPDLEPNWRRRFPIELRSSSVFTGY